MQDLYNPIAPLAINGVAKTRFAVRSQPHWLEQLKVIDLFIEEKTQALHLAKVNRRKFERKLNKKKFVLGLLLKLPRLLQLLFKSLLIDLNLELEAQHLSALYYDVKVEDATLELDVVFQEKQRILNERPFLKVSDRVTLQEVYAQESFEAQLSHTLAIKLLSHESQLPEEVVQVLFDLDTETAIQVLCQAKQKSELMQTKVFGVYTLERLFMNASEDKKKEVLQLLSAEVIDGSHRQD